MSDDPEAEEDIPGALIVRIRENLDFGFFLSFDGELLFSRHICSKHCTAQRSARGFGFSEAILFSSADAFLDC
jgi:hypothetical protein